MTGVLVPTKSEDEVTKSRKESFIKKQKQPNNNNKKTEQPSAGFEDTQRFEERTVLIA